ncbi:MAG: uracil-DNA glycosylase [Sulfuricurvum sp.]|uniref:uracil-DNA glycosylase n=1 Tax=Sulfuricurvum sp. TaxID=2025608 RepID=UPI00260DEF96|nr:uracil-DNA glycosylase [Sulfuricurvum sp.]MDD2830053.1 uracil-DNA glycosylase [Sulfuricurvum sp.]MDD4950639.1 uracil-DNA glycosylase [Sulfuricurvum sp.]
MNSYQNLALLENLYRLKALGFNYIDPISPNKPQEQTSTLPNSYDTLVTTIQKCHLCDLSKSRSQSMSGFGSQTPKILFLDAFVSSAEDESNSYYTGRSGSMLRDMIEKVLKLTIHDVYMTHAVKCKPFGFQQPSLSECNSCSPYLHKQLEILSPKIIVTLGEEAYRLLSHDESGYDHLIGQSIPYGNSIIIPMVHPSFLIRNPSFKPEAMRTLLSIKEALK